MTPTPRLRFVERTETISTHTDGSTIGRRVHILQQWWTVTGTLPEFQHQYGEWRDVPVEKEA